MQIHREQVIVTVCNKSAAYECRQCSTAAAAIDRYLLPAEPTAANLQKQTDRQTEGRLAVA